MAYPTPEAAESAFYAAFEARDLAVMTEVWAPEPGTFCVHPLTTPLAGHTAILAGWRAIFEAAGRFRIAVTVLSERREPGLVIRLVEESLTIGSETGPRPPILATNIYRQRDAGWQLVLHHASPVQSGQTESRPTPHRIVH